MPCDIGWKIYEKVEIPVPVPQEFSERSEAPAIDADLLEKLGVEDPEFLAWASELNTRPLLEEALARALGKVGSGGIDFTIDSEGMLSAKGSYTTSAQKAALKEKSAAISDRWQFEILGIVAELLDYTVTITQKGDELTLEAEEAGKTHPCDYIKVTRRGTSAEITFEHFKSRKALELAEAKFVALADKLGVKLSIKTRDVREGDPFPESVQHGHPHAHRHGHHHHGHDHDHEH